jgi:phage terminase large subunit-like protein
LQNWSQADKNRLLATLKFGHWRNQARPDQLPPPGKWRTAYLRGGRGSGKTWSGAHILAEWILADPEPGEWGIVAPTFEDGWATCVEGPSGIIACLGTSVAEIKQRKSPLLAYWNRSFGELRFRNGHLIRVASADDGGLRIQGKNLKGAWADEIGLWDKWDIAWSESLGYAVRLGHARIIVTGTPKASRKARVLVRQLLDDPNVPVARLRTVDNAANLSEAFFADVVGRAKGTKLERQELEGELMEDVEGALWTVDMIDADRIEVKDAPTDFTRVVVAVDPAVTANENSDETGIIVAGEKDGHGYVIADYSRVASPNAVMERVVQAYRDHQADCVVGEVNNGGDYIGTVLHSIDQNVPYHVVRASRGKVLRAEPVSALYEQHRVHHIGSLPDLEDQMVTWTPDAVKSPDRVDALVYSIFELHALTDTSWASAYNTRTCGGCGRTFVREIDGVVRDRCPHCGHSG